MDSNPDNSWLPERTTTGDGQLRRVGIEIELAGVGAQDMSQLIQDLYGGSIVEKTRFEIRVNDTVFGDFVVELDSSALKDIAERQAQKRGAPSKLEALAEDLLTKTSEQLVPWEIVSPPIVFGDAAKLTRMVDKLREKGALGTRHAVYYAFGVHLNPELPALDSLTIVAYLRAYFCLYDWIVSRERIDITRRITPYIDHFPTVYIEKLIDWTYEPSEAQLIDDYLEHNATRNRSMDMLPLFAHLDARRVKAGVDDPRISPRPTFHYRLSNCDIDNPDWNLDKPWGLWLTVEKLSNDQARLKRFCEEYGEHLRRLTHTLDNRWLDRTGELLADCG